MLAGKARLGKAVTLQYVLLNTTYMASAVLKKVEQNQQNSYSAYPSNVPTILYAAKKSIKYYTQLPRTDLNVNATIPYFGRLTDYYSFYSTAYAQLSQYTQDEPGRSRLDLHLR